MSTLREKRTLVEGVESITVLWEYFDSRVTSPTRPGVTRTLADTVATQKSMDLWRFKIQQELTPTETPFDTCEMSHKKTATTLTFTMKFGNKEIADWIYTKATGMIEFKTRPAFDISWSEFVWWREHSVEFLNMAQNF